MEHTYPVLVCGLVHWDGPAYSDVVIKLNLWRTKVKGQWMLLVASNGIWVFRKLGRGFVGR